MRVATSCSPLLPLLQSTAPNGWFGRTSLASCPVTQDETLRAFWDSSAAKVSKSLKKDGATAESSLATKTPTALPTECWTLNTLAWHSGATVCSLSDVLERTEVPQRYFLSAKACLGILRRAAVRMKKLPKMLSMALWGAVNRATILEMGSVAQSRLALLQAGQADDQRAQLETTLSQPSLTEPPSIKESMPSMSL